MNGIKWIKRPLSPLVFLFGAVVLYIILWSVSPQSFITSDPWQYSLHAYNTLQGTFFINPPDHIFCFRLAVFFPTAFFYGLFGVSIITTNLWPLFAALVIMITVWSALPTNKSRIFSLIICVTSFPLFKASTALYPDVIAAAFMGLSSLFLFYREKTLNDKVLYRLYPLLAVCFLFVAFLAKLSAYWMLPLWIITIISDIRKRNIILLKRFYIPAITVGIILGAVYLLFCSSIWGDPFARFKSIQALSGQHLWSWEHISLFDILERFVIGPIKLFLREYKMVAIFAFFSLFVIPKSLRFWAYYTVLTVLFFWFGTTSFSQYQPMPLFSRMALPSLPGFCILGAYFAARLHISLNRWQRINNMLVSLLIVALISLPFLNYVNSWRHKTLPEAHALRIVRLEVAKEKESKFLMVCSDSRSPKSLAFYFGYRYPKNLVVISAENLDSERLLGSDKVFIFLDENRSRFLESAYGQKHYDQQIGELNLLLLYQQDGVFLYKTTQPSDLMGLSEKLCKLP